MIITEDKYEEEINKFNSIKIKEFWPSKEEIEIFNSEPEKYIMFAFYLQHKLSKPQTEEEKESRKLLNEFVTENLEIKCTQ